MPQRGGGHNRRLAAGCRFGSFIRGVGRSDPGRGASPGRVCTSVPVQVGGRTAGFRAPVANVARLDPGLRRGTEWVRGSLRSGLRLGPENHRSVAVPHAAAVPGGESFAVSPIGSGNDWKRRVRLLRRRPVTASYTCARNKRACLAGMLPGRSSPKTGPATARTDGRGASDQKVGTAIGWACTLP